MFQVIPARPRHLHEIEVRPEMGFGVPSGWEESNPDAREILAAYARTFVEGGEVLAVVGLIPRWRGVATAWTMLSVAAIRCYPVALTHRVARLLQQGFEVHRLHRVEAYTPCDFEPGHDWLYTLGFDREDERGMRKFGPDGEDWALFARVA